MSTFVSIVVPSYRRPDDLRRCLEALAHQLRRPDEVLVVLRPGDVESLGVTSAVEAPGILTVEVHKGGLAAALRAGAEAAQGDVIVFLDDDAFPRPEWLSTLCHHFDDPSVGAVGGKDEIPNPSQTGPPTVDIGRITRWGKLIGNHHLAAGAVREVDVLKGVNMAVRRQALVLPLDLRGTGTQLHSELVVCLCAQRDGWRILFDPAAVVDHRGSPRPGGDSRDSPSAAVVRNESFNLVACLLTARPELLWRRGLYGLMVGDRGTPGLVRGLAAVLQRDREVTRRLLPSLLGQLEALSAHIAGRRVPVAGIRPRTIRDGTASRGAIPSR
jgi:GT2 family glycosyltransferase